MTITIDDYRSRLAQLDEQRQTLTDQLNATLGAMQDCEFWIAQLLTQKPIPGGTEDLVQSRLDAGVEQP